ncbi:MAG: hypothetical protein OFPII_17530 [Osedax symbiont Rs1]|nr:MAG: hypothetical protein OFPII_17530 [Osedax symbiont Rs1]
MKKATETKQNIAPNIRGVNAACLEFAAHHFQKCLKTNHSSSHPTKKRIQLLLMVYCSDHLQHNIFC